ncbi:MAG: AAA family ATPase, partial [bacterium]
DGTLKRTADTEKILVLDVENGSHALDVARVDLWEMEFSEIGKTLLDLSKDPSPLKGFHTIVIDSWDWLAQKMEKHLCRKHQKNSLSEFQWGSGNQLMVEETYKLLQIFDRLKDYGITIHILAHVKTTQVEDPISATVYSKWDLALQTKQAAKLKEWVDVFGFAYYKPPRFDQQDLGFGRTRSVAKGEESRVIAFQESLKWEAKSRYPLPAELPLDYPKFAEAMRKAKGL